MISVAIIGAGMTGLACARTLALAGLKPVLFDKGRGIGGRVATRRAEGLQFDHGAQYVTAKGVEFAGMLDGLAATGQIVAWNDGTGRPKLVGAPGMSSLAKAMGEGLDIRQNAAVTRVMRANGGWLLRVAGGDVAAARVVITVPAPQVTDLLGADHPLVAALAPVRIDPCLTLMAALHGPAPFISRADPDDDLAWIAQDSSKPGRPARDAVAWVAQAGIGFSMAHLEKPAAEIAALMLPLLCDRLRANLDTVRHATAHRWRYARVSTPLGRPFIHTPNATLYLGGDWCVGPRVEAAWTSGTTLARHLLVQMQ